MVSNIFFLFLYTTNCSLKKLICFSFRIFFLQKRSILEIISISVFSPSSLYFRLPPPLLDAFLSCRLNSIVSSLYIYMQFQTKQLFPIKGNHVHNFQTTHHHNSLANIYESTLNIQVLLVLSNFQYD